MKQKKHNNFKENFKEEIGLEPIEETRISQEIENFQKIKQKLEKNNNKRSNNLHFSFFRIENKK